jgi:hypothetical protein
MTRLLLLALATYCCFASVSSTTNASEKPKRETKPLLDPTPGPGQKPYQPADGQIMEVNPPAFIWVSAGRGATYALQLSHSEFFPPEDTRTIAGLTRTVFVAREPLSPGRWFWRYGVETKHGTVFGRARLFSVPRSARLFPLPDFEKVAQNVPKGRPRLFLTGEQLAKIRAAAKGELKAVVRELVQSCEGAVGETLVPEPDYQPKEPGQRGSWMVRIMSTTRPPMDKMEQCALAYLVTGNKRLGLEAKRRLLYFFSWDPEGPTSFFAYDEPPMWVMMRGTRAYDWTYDLFTPEERTKIESNMKARALQFLKRLRSLPFESNPYDSHAGRLPGFLGECALSFVHEWPEAREWLEYVTMIYMTSYPAWGGDDGGWQEGPGYWSAYMGFATHFVVALRQAIGVDLMLKPFFRNTPNYALYTATPYHENSPFGDGQTGPPLGPRAVMYAFSSLTQNPFFRWYAEAAGYAPGADVLSLATYDPALKARSPLELPQAREFPGVGLVSMHTALGNKERDISFLLRSSPFGSVSHGHADQNAFVVEAFGRGLAIATGYYPWYGSPHHSQWTRATRAVNSILVDGQGQVQRSPAAKGAITAFLHGEGYDYTEGEAGAAYGDKLKRFRRHVVHVRPGVFVILDDLTATKPATFQWLLHAHEKIAVDEPRQLLTIRREPATMEVRLLLPAGLAFAQNDRYEPEPERVKRGEIKNTWHLTAATTTPSTTSRFLSVLTPHRVGGEPPVAKVELVQGDGAVGVRLRFPDGAEDVVAFRTDADAEIVSCGGLRSDALAFARGRTKDGAVKRRLMYEGIKLEETSR